MKTHVLSKFILAGILSFSLFHESSAQANNNNGGNIDLNFVRFNLLVDPSLAGSSTNLLRASVTYYFETTQASVQKLKFDFYKGNAGNFTPHAVTPDNFVYHGATTALSAANQTNDTLIINLPTAITSVGTLDSLTITYHGAPYQNTGASRGYYKTTVTTSGDMVTSHSAGFYARQWWPCKHNMTDKIDSVEFLITTPAAYKAVGNGVLMNGPTPPTDGSGNKTWYWKTRYPIAHYLIAFAVHNYTVYNSPSATVSGTTVPIVNYLTASTNNATVKANCDAMKGVIEYFSTVFGDYPFKNEKYGHVTYTFGGGMENQTASYFGESTLNAADRSTMAHELAHQWFGDRVTCSKWNNNWVNEGFARHAELTYNEHFISVATANTKRASYQTSGKSASNTVYRYDVEVVNVADHGTKIFPSAMVYDKASIVISMLRRLVGDVKFYQTLRNYLADPLVSYGYATTDDVRRHFEATSGKDLTAFFDDFIMKAGYPTYSNVQWAYDASSKRVAIKLGTQTKTTTGATYPVTGRFHTVLPIRLQGPSIDTVIAAYDDGVLSLSALAFPVSSAVTSITLDPYNESYSFNNGPVSQNNALISLLPVNLLSIDAYKADNKVNIVWKTNDEVNFSHYEVERSTDGITFTKIGSVPATNLTVNHYQFLDNSPLEGINYYRLKMVDIDGKYKYSMVLSVHILFVTGVKIMPNPANDVVKIITPDNLTGDVSISLINLQGQTIKLSGRNTGQNIIEVNVKNFPSGNYLIEIRSNGNKIVERILIQH